MTEKQYEIMRDLSGYFKPGERKAIYNTCESTRDRTLIRLLWKSGRRVSEVLLVKIKDIDFDRSSILWHIKKKSEKKDGIRIKKDLRKWKPVDDFTLRLIKHYIIKEGINVEGYLFPSPFKKNRPITRQRVFQIIRRLCKKCGIDFVGEKKPHPHHFRHSIAIDIAKNLKTPADLRKLQMMLEHANLGITEQYLQFNESEMKDILEMSNDDD